MTNIIFTKKDMREIINDIFNENESIINRSKYIKYYSKIYSIINMLDYEDNNIFELNIKKYIKENLKHVNINMINYFQQFNKFNKKVKNGSKLFIYYNSEFNILIKMFLEVWEEIVLSQLFPLILENIEFSHNIKVVDYNNPLLFNEINSYYSHLYYINKDLGEIFKNTILKNLKNNIQKNNLEDIDTILTYINNYEMINDIFYNNYDSKDSKKEIFKNVNDMITNNISKIDNYFIYLISNINQNQNKNKIDETKKIVEIIKKYSNDTYYDNILYLFKNYYKKTSYSTIDDMFNDLINIKYLYNTIFLSNNINSKTINYHLDYSIRNFASEEEHISYVKNISKNTINELDNILNDIIINLQDNFDAKFNNELIKYLNKYIHNKSVIENINIIVNLLKDKESFIVYYKNGLTKRLLNDHVNLENEKYLINILMNNDSLLDVSMMNVMLNDYHKSMILNIEYNNLFNNSNNVLLITYDIWNFRECSYNNKFNSISFKNELELMENNFKTYYKTNNETKNVKFIHNISKCIIPFNNIDLVCNYLQADLLYMFNDINSIDLNKTNINEDLLVSLTKPKLLIKKNNIVKVNSKFKYKEPLLDIYKLYNQTKKINKSIKKDLNKIILDKKDIIDCVIISFLKKNQTRIITFNNILQIINNKLSKKITINNDLLYERLLYLIEKEYISISTINTSNISTTTSNISTTTSNISTTTSNISTTTSNIDLLSKNFKYIP